VLRGDEGAATEAWLWMHLEGDRQRLLDEARAAQAEGRVRQAQINASQGLQARRSPSQPAQGSRQSSASKKSSPAKTPPAVNMFASLDRRSSSGRQMSDQQLVQNFARKTSSSTAPTERGRSNTRAGSQTVASGSGTVAVTHQILQTNFAGGPAELTRSPSSSPAPVAGQRRTRQDTSSGNATPTAPTGKAPDKKKQK
jgi:hypothetical protein